MCFGIGSAASLNLALFAELFCSLLVILGFLTRLALVPLIITMVVAFFIFNAAEPMLKKELPLIFLLTYIAIYLLGPGRFSLDSLIYKPKKSIIPDFKK
ncbi:MAG TPA: DoxX family protein [Ignavibacteria bacterium]|nr:DoxX family protein [Ignavibacteria bacterium]